MSQPHLSICIATYNRAAFIGETLQSIVGQMTPDVELLVLDGASPDDTEAVVANYLPVCPGLRYCRESVNSGVDRDYDKAVELARGKYCWLMTDDDLLLPGGLERIIAALEDSPELLVLNAEVRSVEFQTLLQPRLLDVCEDREFEPDQAAPCFEELAPHLKFIGAVVVSRAAWMSRTRDAYYGTLFIHVGVIFQSPPIGRVRMLADPVMVIRYGNAMWTPRGFEIWMFKWPGLIWAFKGYTESSKGRVSARYPSRKLAKLGVHRALGGYSMLEFRKYYGRGTPMPARTKAFLVASIPAKLANALASLACLMMPRKARLNLYDLARCRHSTWVSRRIANLLGV